MGVTASHIEHQTAPATITPLPRNFDTVTRRLDRSLWSLQELLDVLPGAERLQLETPFEAHYSTPPVLCATGRLYGSGFRMARSTRVVLELMAWSGGTTELRLRPLTRRVPNWSERRRRRYFDSAHDTMDELVRLLGGAARSHEVVLHTWPDSTPVSDPTSPATTPEDRPRENRAAS